MSHSSGLSMFLQDSKHYGKEIHPPWPKNKTTNHIGMRSAKVSLPYLQAANIFTVQMHSSHDYEGCPDQKLHTSANVARYDA